MMVLAVISRVLDPRTWRSVPYSDVASISGDARSPRDSAETLFYSCTASNDIR